MSKRQSFYVLPARMWLLALGVAAVSGCATQYPTSTSEKDARYVLSSDAATPIENEQLDEFLSQSPPGGVLNVADSPWGEQVEIVSDARYLAASGRECRQLKVVGGNAETTQALVCKSDKGWVDQRVVTQSEEGRTE